MPNWCYTNITISHHDETKVEDLYKKICEWSHKDFCENGFHDGWLGNIVGNSGIADPLGKDAPRCRGTLNSIYFEGGQISLSTETAWAPMLKMWRMLLDKYLPDAELIFTAEEPGCGLFETNDPDVIGKYYIDVCDDPPEDADKDYCDSCWDAEEDYTRTFLQKALKTEESDINKLIKMNDDSWFYVSQWEESRMEEWG